MIYGAGDIRMVELNENVSGIKENGINKIIIENASSVASEKLDFLQRIHKWLNIMAIITSLTLPGRPKICVQ